MGLGGSDEVGQNREARLGGSGAPPGERCGSGEQCGSGGAVWLGGRCAPLELERQYQGGQWGLRPEWPQGGVQKGQ